MRFKKGVHTLASAVLLSLCAAVPAFATFAPVHSVVFGPDRNNYDDSFKDHGNKFHISYTREDGVPRIVVKQHSKVIYTKEVPSLGRYYTMEIHQIVNEDDGRNFYIVQSKDSEFAYLMGYDEKSKSWQTYTDARNYYSPVAGEAVHEGITVHYGDLGVYHFNNLSDRYHWYKLFWDKNADWFGYKEGKETRRTTYFNSALVYNPQYRPVYANADYETYLDMDSFDTDKDKDGVWTFTAKKYETIMESDILTGEGQKVKYRIDTNTGRAYIYNKQTRQWDELPIHSTPSSAEMADSVAVNWACKHHFGFFLGDLGGAMGRYIADYKGDMQ